MKKKNSLLFILLMYSLTMLAQKDITKFMGIPVDGFKKDMIQKLKAKGFEYDNEIDLLTGEFNGEKVNIFVATQSNKVWRIVVADAIERNEHDIKIRFNNLYDQFNDNPKYVPKLEDNDYISEDINLAYEMKVRNKRFEAGFMQMTNPKSPQNSPEKIQQEFKSKPCIFFSTLFMASLISSLLALPMSCDCTKFRSLAMALAASVARLPIQLSR